MTTLSEVFVPSSAQRRRFSLICALGHASFCRTSEALARVAAELDRPTTADRLTSLLPPQPGLTCFTCVAAGWAVTSFLYPQQGYVQAARECYVSCRRNEAAQQFQAVHPGLNTWTQADLNRALAEAGAEAEAAWDTSLERDAQPLQPACAI